MEHILTFSEEYHLLPRDGLILVALSGGPDSVALLHFLKNAGFTVAGAHFDHHLRETSGRDARFAADFCRTLDVPFYLGGAQVGDMPGNTEDNARKARYAFLEETAKAVGAARIATAHNANDNLETVLLHLTRGCGLQGLSGIWPRRDRIVRPMLHTTRRDIEDYLAREGLTYVTDETNADDRYARNRLRHQVVPVLESLNPRVVEAAVRMTDYLRQDLARLGPRMGPDGPLPPPVEPRDVEAWVAWVNRGRPSEPLLPLEPRAVTVGERFETELWVLETQRAVCPETPPTPNAFYLKPTEPLTLRSRRAGDRLHPPFRTGKSVKKWMIETGVPRWKREAVPVLVCGERVLSVAGLGPQQDALAAPGEDAIYVRWTKQ